MIDGTIFVAVPRHGCCIDATSIVLICHSASIRWILHRNGDGDDAVDLLRTQVPATTVIDRSPRDGWISWIERESDRLQIRVAGQAGDVSSFSNEGVEMS